MISPDDALACVLRNVTPLPPRPVALEMALGRSLAEDVRAPHDFPPFDRSMMDGFAVQRKEKERYACHTGCLNPGEVRETPLEPGTCVEIMTGWPCPPGTEMVVPYEDVLREEGRIFLPPDPVPGQFIVRRGEECRKGKTVLSSGLRVTPLVIAVLASFGREEVLVSSSPRIAILVTGDEVVQGGTPSGPGQIADANGPMLYAMAQELGVSEIRSLFSKDRLDDLTQALEEVESEEIVLMTGGVSEGLFDLVPEALRKTGAEILFHKVSQKPGKPMLFARKGSRLYFGLPGNPLSAHLGFHRYVAPCIRIMQGNSSRRARGQSRALMPPQGGLRTRFDLLRSGKGSTPEEVTVYAGRNSSDLFSVCGANGIVRIPPAHPEELETIPEIMEFEWLGNRWEEE